MCPPAVASRAAFIDSYVDENSQLCVLWWRRASRHHAGVARHLSILSWRSRCCRHSHHRCLRLHHRRHHRRHKRRFSCDGEGGGEGWPAFLERSEGMRRGRLGDVDPWVAGCAARTEAHGSKFGAGRDSGGMQPAAAAVAGATKMNVGEARAPARRGYRN